MLRLLNFSDDADVAEAGWDIGTKEIKRSLRRDGLNLNLTYTLSNGKFLVDLNFHHVVDCASAARKWLLEHVVTRKADGLKLLAETLQLQLQEG